MKIKKSIIKKRTRNFDLKIGQKIIFKKRMTKKFFTNSISYLDDYSKIHTSNLLAKKIGFKKKVFPGLAVTSFFSKMIGSKISKHNIVILKIEFNFKLPVYENDLLVYKCVIKNILFPIKIILMDLEIKKGNKITVSGQSTCKFMI